VQSLSQPSPSISLPSSHSSAEPRLPSPHSAPNCVGVEVAVGVFVGELVGVEVGVAVGVSA